MNGYVGSDSSESQLTNRPPSGMSRSRTTPSQHRSSLREGNSGWMDGDFLLLNVEQSGCYSVAACLEAGSCNIRALQRQISANHLQLLLFWVAKVKNAGVEIGIDGFDTFAADTWTPAGNSEMTPGSRIGVGTAVLGRPQTILIAVGSDKKANASLCIYSYRQPRG